MDSVSNQGMEVDSSGDATDLCTGVSVGNIFFLTGQVAELQHRTFNGVGNSPSNLIRRPVNSGCG